MALLRGRRQRRFLDAPGFDPLDPATTVLAADLRFAGDVRTAGDAVVAATIEGSLEVGGRLLLAAGALVRGPVTARDARIEGIVEGPVSVAGRLEIGREARVAGHIHAGLLAVAEGAVLQGDLEIPEPPVRFVERREG